NSTGKEDVNFHGLEHEVFLQFRNVFMLHLPRICEHCLNAACVASCPSGAIYKRDEDGIVLVDQERCRGWRFCVSGCPYKKVYFNWKTGRSEKCLFCYPRIESGMPTLCAETCVGRIRYIGVLLYDAEKIYSAAATPYDRDVYGAQMAMLLDPGDPEVRAQAARDGIPPNIIDAALRSPVYKLAVAWKLALPPHPEFRTLPMVWYVPPLSPMISATDPGGDGLEPDSMRIPVRYLANLLAAGDEAPVRLALSRLMALRAYMRSVLVDKSPRAALLDSVGLTVDSAEQMYRLLAIAKYEDRYVVPTAPCGDAATLHVDQGDAGFPRRGGS
ncbi:4Fe-4S dicluster domain-containing protein, partial [Aminiphilus sp.]|uniref:4Fe-4S dicluster domain-containing protein n=1 Tax=Aminiphilus sp. TaxID=1872488 RepID=UPI002606A922